MVRYFFGSWRTALIRLARLHQQLVGIVVQRRILEELAGSAFALVEPVGNAVQTGDGVVELARQFLVLGQPAEGAFAGIDTRRSARWPELIALLALS